MDICAQPMPSVIETTPTICHSTSPTTSVKLEKGEEDFDIFRCHLLMMYEDGIGRFRNETYGKRSGIRVCGELTTGML